MSGGTPVGGGYMRQRHSQGYASGGDDLEDDACSRPQSFSPSSPRARSWVEIAENVLWVASAVFIVYFGDRKSNFIYLLWHDDRIRRLPLYFGMACVGVNIVIFFYTSIFSWSLRRFNEKWELLSISALPFVTLLGLVSFCLFSFALWPIWSFLTLPLVFTLFMACMVIFPRFVMGNFRSPNDSFRID
ncbi:transmembrane protein 128-like [Tripterygium wilfordii]|uniref:transmembrane protein 128-like n=1 Tax=Tripterygium wilfordii TaxID=458696 RepID=UPI0018F84B3A|nr:transmembrane protein 128-like [Tripterygium wilfordii]XP_038699431.1 transmembrane protein 128-like [Tripterygium wilfordii]